MELLFDLDSFLARVSERVGRASTVVVTHGATLSQLENLSPDRLRAVAAQHGLRVARRMNGASYEFTRRAS